MARKITSQGGAGVSDELANAALAAEQVKYGRHPDDPLVLSGGDDKRGKGCFPGEDGHDHASQVAGTPGADKPKTDRKPTL